MCHGLWGQSGGQFGCTAYDCCNCLPKTWNASTTWREHREHRTHREHREHREIKEDQYIERVSRTTRCTLLTPGHFHGGDVFDRHATVPHAVPDQRLQQLAQRLARPFHIVPAQFNVHAVPVKCLEMLSNRNRNREENKQGRTRQNKKEAKQGPVRN